MVAALGGLPLLAARSGERCILILTGGGVLFLRNQLKSITLMYRPPVGYRICRKSNRLETSEGETERQTVARY